MINEQYKAMLGGKSVIRQLSEYATARGGEIGYDNVFDFTLGNPSVPCSGRFTDEMLALYKESDPIAMHGYSPSPGIYSVREKVAQSLNRRFSTGYGAEHIFMTSGAAGALAHALRCVTKPGDKVITFAPYFPEYIHYVGCTGAKLSIVEADKKTFEINFEALEKELTSDTAAILVNTPNNPSGTVYCKETIKKLAAILNEKQREFGHDIFIISDEPYREIVFDGKQTPYISNFYDNTLSCYSFSKSLSLPGERIGYVAANPRCTDSDLIVPICTQISRGIGHNCPASSIQLGIAEVLDETSDLSVYETNMNLLYDALTDIGFECRRPGGTFYMFPKALEEDATAFCLKAKEYDLILVPSDSFGCEGHFRIAYCTDTEKVKRSLDVFRRFASEVYGM